MIDLVRTMRSEGRSTVPFGADAPVGKSVIAMEDSRACPLSVRLLRLLEICMIHNTTETKELAKIMQTSRHTIDDKFKRINKKLETCKRDAALRLAVSKGWIVVQASQPSSEPPSRAAMEQPGTTPSTYPNFGVLQVFDGSAYNLAASRVPVPWPNLADPAAQDESRNSLAERYEIVGVVVREKGTSRISRMNIEDREEFVDLVAQAVIDKIEERDRITGLVHLVVQRVIEIQKEEADAKALAAAEGIKTENDVLTEAA